MMRDIEIPWGREHISFSLPEENLAWLHSPRDAAPLKDEEEAVRSAIRKPLAGLGLKELATRYGRRVLIVGDDLTRITPQRLILPILLDELNASGVPDSSVTLLVALGTHRPMTPTELEQRFSAEVLARVRVVNHDAFDPSALVDLGPSKLGYPITVNRLCRENDWLVTVGNVIPHFFAGWAGGAKMILPGICGLAPVGKTHLKAASRYAEIVCCIDNPVRQAMEEAGARASLRFAINTVLDQQGKLVWITAGDPVASHRAAVAIAEKVYVVEIAELADTVVASSYPADIDLWQGTKPLGMAALAAKKGGTLILATPSPEGVAPTHPIVLELGRATKSELDRLASEGKLYDEVGASVPYVAAQVRERVRVVLVTEGVTEEETACLGFERAPSVEAALEEALRRHGPRSRVGVVTHGAELFLRHQPGLGPAPAAA